MADRMSGGCACGRIRYTAQIDSDEAYLCHCRMCQRASGNISLAMKNVEQGDVSWEREPDWYRSSPIAQRPYCRECGSSLGFRYDENTTKIDLTVASFDDPSRFKPTSHFGAEFDAPGVDQHRGPARAPLRGVPAAGRSLDRGDGRDAGVSLGGPFNAGSARHGTCLCPFRAVLWQWPAND